MNAKQLIEYIIDPTLKQLKLYSEEAAKLVLYTAAHESKLGRYLHQIKGPALGLYQVEPATHRDILKNFLHYRSGLARSLAETSKIDVRYLGDDNLLMTNLVYATAICRIHYLRVPEPIPTDIEGMARYYKENYNTYLGRGKEADFIKAAEKIKL